MNRNRESHFSQAPQVQIERARWNMPQSIKTSGNVGQVIPFFWSSVLPGDTWRVKTAKLIRMQTLKTPMMDDIYLDTYYFFVPNRLVWEHWQNFMGESETAWKPEVEYTVPQLEAPANGFDIGSVADYFGVPPLVPNISVNALPFRAYAKIIEDWFRDVNLQDAQVIELGDSDVVGLKNGTGTNLTEPSRGGSPFIAAKMHDFFTSMLPEPQRGDSVQVGLMSGAWPVYTVEQPNSYYYDDSIPNTPPNWLRASQYSINMRDAYPVQYGTYPLPNSFNGADWEPVNYVQPIHQTRNDASYDGVIGTHMTVNHTENTGSSYIEGFGIDNGVSTPINGFTNGEARNTFKTLYPLTSSDYYNTLTPVNLVAGAPAESTLISINQLRTAFQIQRFYERSARSGNRYISILKGMFGVTSPDARLQRAEYLGGNRVPLNIRQVIQTSETTSNNPLGDLAAISVTGDNNFDFEKSFTEHGYLIGVMVARYKHTYQQGIEPELLRKSIFEFYWPTLAHLGEFGYTNETIYATGTATDKEIFGYNEAWADYRYKPDRVSGMMRSVANTSLDTWHLADYYNSQPYLSDEWIQEDKSNVDRVLSVSSAVSNQYFADIKVDSEVTRPMPLYSIPGLIDHF